MTLPKRIELPLKYGFPNFTKQANNIYLCGSQNLIVSDIWSFTEVQCENAQVTQLNAMGYNVILKDGNYMWEESYTLHSSNITRQGYYAFS